MAVTGPDFAAELALMQARLAKYERTEPELEIVMERLPLTLAMLCATHAVDLHSDGRGRITIVAVVRDAPPGALCRRGVGRTVDAALAALEVSDAR